MLRATQHHLKKAYSVHPGNAGRGGKELEWRPKMGRNGELLPFVWPYMLESPSRRPTSWSRAESNRLGLEAWPKQVGFYNAGDNFELTPEMMWRLFKRNCDRPFWGAAHNEKAIVHQMPLVEKDPQTYMPRVEQIFRAHVERFGADHVIYNAAMQAAAFARDIDRVKSLFAEMQTLGLEPSAQSFVNVILALKLCGRPKEAAFEVFSDAVRTGAMQSVMRMDTEFDMWWSQLDRMGSFTAPYGYLANKDEGAVPLPRDPFAIWGWDATERKFESPQRAAKFEARRRGAEQGVNGTVHAGYRREPWAKRRGLAYYDFKGPVGFGARASVNDNAPKPAMPRSRCGPAY